MKSYDVIWIGTGQATGTVVPRLSNAGKTVAVVEGGRFGGSCVNYGCTPTKTLVASARAAHMARRGPDFGVHTGEVSINFDTVMARMNKMRGGHKGMEQWLRHMKNVDVYGVFGTFVDERTVQVGDEQIRGETIVINAGGRARELSIPGLAESDYLNNRRLLDLTELPEKLVVVGGSYIGMEFAQIFRRLGSEVTVIEGGPQLMSREDADLAAAALGIFEAEGIDVVVNARVQSVKQHGPKDVSVNYTIDDVEHSASGTHLLMATGRVPNSDRLNLGAAGIEATSRGFITVNDHMQTNHPHIYAVGDINGQGAFTHTSVNDGEIFWDHYVGDPNGRKLSDRIMIYAMFIDPPLGRIGMSEKQARQSGRNVLMATRPMKYISRAKEKDETAGLIKILVDADTEEFLGVGMIGVGGDEIINIFAPFMMAKASYKLFRRSVLTHPTVAELLPWILDDLKPLE